MNKRIKKIIEIPENIYYHINFFYNDVKNEIIWGWQRLFRGYDDRWFWSIADNLTPILIDCIKYYKSKNDSYPTEFKNRKEWDKILDKIIKGFEIKNKIDYLQYEKFKNRDDFIKEYKRLEKIKIKGMKLFAKYYDNLWD